MIAPTPRLWPRIVVLALTALCTSCASESITAPSGSTLTLSVPTRSVSVNGTAVLTAELRSNAGQPMAGATIAFSTTLGTIEPAEIVTGGTGLATVVFSAGTASGTAVISAGSGSIRANPVSLSVGTAAVGRVALTASPASVPFGGGTSTVTAVVTDAAGNPLKSMPVEFTTTTGNLTPANAKTDTNGIVLTTLTTAASAVVTAVAGSTPVDKADTQISSLTGSVTVGVAPRPVPVVSIVASPNPVAGSPVTFTIGAMPAPGTTNTIQNVVVDFGDGNRTNLGAVSGAAIVVQHVYANGGTYTVTMTATDSAGGTSIASTVLAVKAATPLTVSVVAGPMVPTGGGPNAIVTLTATVLPASAVIASYLWDFGDDGGVQRTANNQVQHVFAKPGLYTVTVTATEALTDRTGEGSVPVSTTSAMPTVSLTASANPVAGRPVTFLIAAAVAAGSSVTMENVRVIFGDGTPPVDLGGVIGTGLSAGHVYASAGTYLARVIATDSVRGTATASVQVVVAAPTAPSVTVSVTGSPVAGAPTTFAIGAAPAPGSGNTIQNVQVTFGDGTAPVDLGAVSGSTTTQHVYAASGSYTVSVTATDTGGATATASVQVVVPAPGAPSVAVTASANPVVGNPVTFTVTAAPAAGSNTTITNVQVNFGDGTAPVNLGAVSSPASAQHVFATAGAFTVSAMATASNGATATASTQVVVAAAPANVPTVSVTASASPVAGSAATFTITAAPAAGSNTTITNVQVNFGDGTAPVNLGAVSSPATTQHVFAAAGNYTVSVTATASNSATATASTQVVVAAAPPNSPSVSVTASASPVAGSAVTFTITAAPAPGSNTTITNVQVNFGDGTAPVNLGAVSSPATAQHVFATAGNYTVTATATASNNATATASTQVVVAAAPPNSPSVSVTASANPIAGRAVTFTVTAAPAPGSNSTITSVRVNFGDGTPVVDLGAVSSPTTTQHAYAVAATYTVSATATASNGVATTVSIQLVVAPPPAPSVSIVASANPVTGRATTFTITAAPAPGSSSPPTVRVNFGDSAESNVGAVNGTATTQHVYSVQGTYTVSATATDVGGGTAIARTDVTVVAAANVSIMVAGAPVASRVAAQFTVTVSPATGVTIQNVTLRYGDGSQDDLGVVSGAPRVVSHTYAGGGTFTVSAVVTISGGTGPLTTSTSVVVGDFHTFSITSSSTNTLHNWPGGTQTFNFRASQSVTIRNPSGNINAPGGDTWEPVSATGYSSCTIVPQVPTCRSFLAGAALLGNGRPWCSNSSDVLGSASTATAEVTCR